MRGACARRLHVPAAGVGFALPGLRVRAAVSTRAHSVQVAKDVQNVKRDLKCQKSPTLTHVSKKKKTPTDSAYDPPRKRVKRDLEASKENY